MKKILHFQVPEYLVKRGSPYNLEQMRKLIEGLKKKFSEDYEIIISPLILQADEMVNITIHPETDIEELVQKLTNIKEE